MQEDSVRVKFDGEISGVDINTFTRVLLDYSTVVRAVSYTHLTLPTILLV